VNFILRDENAVFYECGFSCDNVIFLNFSKERYFITDSRYTIEAKENITNSFVIESKNLIKTAKKLIKKSKIKKLIYNPLEFSKYTFDLLEKDLKVKFVKEINFSQKKRIIKSKDELKNIKKAVNKANIAFDNFAKYLQNVHKLSEKELNFKAKEFLSRRGKFDLSFEPIVALEQNSAKPHALPTDKKLFKNSLILFDAGIKYNRYCSDRTRTCEFNKNIEFSKEINFKDKKRKKIYDIVLKAQESAIKAIKPGVKASKIDKIAREVIAKSGYAKEFSHSTGHGVGLDIHELPRISAKDNSVLEEGMVFTVEPGIYLKGEFGVRIEDMVVVTKNGVEIL